MTGSGEALRADLVAAIGREEAVSAGDSIRNLHGEDLSPHPARRPDLVVFARSVEEIAATLPVAVAHGAPVTPFGAGTSTDGHVIPIVGGISLDLSQMDRIISVSPGDLTAKVEAGVLRSGLDRAAGEHGLFFPVDPGADASLGGMAATNASGTTTVRYGGMRRQVLGMTVVLADGSVLHAGGNTVKSSAGYDLVGLLVGSEGTLGVIAELTLRLYGIPEKVTAARAFFPDLDSACEAAHALISLGASVNRVELLDSEGIRAVSEFAGLHLPIAPCLFLEFSGSPATAAEDAAQAAEIVAENGCTAFATESDPTARARLWRARHEALFAIANLQGGGPIQATDVCVPISELPAAIRAAQRSCRRLGIQAAIIGHVGDGNYHVIHAFDPGDPAQSAAAEDLKEALFEDALARGGTCSGEHGIGIGKVGQLEVEHGDLMPTMRAIKTALDPTGTMNPGKVLRLVEPSRV